MKLKKGDLVKFTRVTHESLKLEHGDIPDVGLLLGVADNHKDERYRVWSILASGNRIHLLEFEFYGIEGQV